MALQQYLGKCYGITGVSISTFLALASYGTALVNPATSFVCMFGSLGSVIGFSMTSPTYENDKNGFLVAKNSGLRQGLYCSFVGLSGLGMSPYFAAMSASCPGVVPASVIITAGICGGASLYSYMKPPGALDHWKGPLYGSLIGIIGL